MKSSNGDYLPNLAELFDQKLTVPIILDIKDHGSAEEIKKIINQKHVKSDQWLITTFLHDEATTFKKLFPDLKILLGSFNRPFHTIKKAYSIGAYGVTFNFITLNIFSYKKAEKLGIKIFLYQNYTPWLLTTPWIVKLVFKLYPNIAIYTDRPDKIIT